MKRFVYAAAAIVLTGVLVLLAMAIAQRDARIGDSSTAENELPYANQPAQPITSSGVDPIDSAFLTNNWPPAPIVRGNDSALPRHSPSSIGNESTPPTHATLTSYDHEGSLPSGPNETPNRARISSSTGRLAEPPPLNANALNSFLSPTANASDSASQANPNASYPSSFPNTLPSSLPSIPNAISNLPSRQSNGNLSPESYPSNQINSLPIEPSSTGFGAPSISTPPRMHTDTDPSNLPSPSRLPSYAPSPSIQELPPVATLGTPLPSNSISSPNFPPSAYSPRGSTANSAPNADAPTISTPSNLSTNSTTPNTVSSPKSVGFSSSAPGLRQLDGSQNPSLEIQKRAPHEVQVGIPSTFTVLVRNVGNATAYDVNVVDSVPKGARLVRTSPQAQQVGQNGLTWKLGEMGAGAEQTITIELVPESEGEIGSVASVNFAAQASVRTMSTQPKLVVKQLLEPVVMGGQSVKIMIEVSNVGTGTARNVRLEEDVPANMRHASGAHVLELPLGDLAPGESQKHDIELTAVSAGKVSNILRAVADNANSNESSAPIEAVSPKLQISLDGPKLRYLERQATYTASITNTGTAMATNVDLIVYLPSGLQFNSAENGGEYIPNQRAVIWQLTELAAGKTASTKVTLLPVEEGDFVLRMQANADSVRADAVEKPVRVEGQSELAFSIEDDNDPIETDGQTTHIIKIVNNGTRVDNDVQLQIDLPEGASVEQVHAPVNYQVVQRAIQFSPIAQMKSKDQQTIRITVRHTREGTHVLRAQLRSKLRPGAVIKEESTQVYRDQ